MSRAKRKSEHIDYALTLGQSRLTGFDDITFVHQSIPESSVLETKICTKIGELDLSSPIFINAMTGGGGEKTFQINHQLAMVARETNIPMAIGSQMSALKDSTEIRTYKVIREVNKKGLLISNIGSEATIDQAMAAIEMIQANALQIHLNTVQELTMPEGDKDFKGALRRIETIVEKTSIPVIVKEVGFGMSMETVSKLKSIGVSAVDVGGFGGTNFSRIENARRERELTFFNNWGIPTAISIIEAKHIQPDFPVIASGGIQNSLDVVKALALGAAATGIAGRFLRTLFENGPEHLAEDITNIKKEVKIIMTALGARRIDDLLKVPIVISGDTHHWLNERGVNTKLFSQRGMQ